MRHRSSRLILLMSLMALHCATVLGQMSDDRLVCRPVDVEIEIRRDLAGNNPGLPRRFIASIPDDFEGSLRLNRELIENLNLRPTISNGIDTVTLTPLSSKNRRELYFYLDDTPPDGECELYIPSSYFMICPDCKEEETFDIGFSVLRSLGVAGSWRVAPKPQKRTPMFTIQDDDGIPGSSSGMLAHADSSRGYLTTLYPVLESLGLKGTVSLEGRRAGFTADPPELNATGMLARRLQDERGWEIQNHSMLCAGETLNCWKVDSLNSPLARKLLADGPDRGFNDIRTVSVYDLKTRRQYMPENGAWIPALSRMVKPYVGDYATAQPLFYDEDFDVDYHWGEWFRLARKFGISGNAWVAHNSISSHALTPKINALCSFGFADNSKVTYNVPPLMSTASRCLLEGQQLPGYKGENSGDNTYDSKEMKFFLQQVDGACKENGWIVFGLHAYRKVWNNSLPGALVSEGGSYPDAWVSPLDGIDLLNDSLSPPAALGISDWSQWHPCPGTRLYMMWELLRYARDKGMINVSSSEGYRIIGNREDVGYFTNGINIGQDEKNIVGTSDRYPHFIESADGELLYYNPLLSDEIKISGIEFDKIDRSFSPDMFSVNGFKMTRDKISNLPAGIWIIDGEKYLITK